MTIAVDSKKIIIIGGGVSGATAAQELAKELNINPQDILILEAEAAVGGKLKTFKHPLYPNLIAEYGAGVLTHNYPIIDNIREKDIQLEKLLPTDEKTVEFAIEARKLNLFQQIPFALDFFAQNVKFATKVWKYNHAYEQLDLIPPKDLEMDFAQYAAKYKLEKIATFLKFLWPGFGYGPYDDANNYTYRVLNYMGYTTMPSIAFANGLVGVKGGYQQIVERMLEGFNVQTAVQIQKVDRDNQGVKIQYQQNGTLFNVSADTLVLATSPYHWQELGMKLTTSEQACVDQLSYYRYPVAICNIKGVKPEQQFFLDALKKKGYGHPAFLFTRDNRKDPEEGRLCTIYINLPRGENSFSLEPGSEGRKILEADLKKIPGVTEVQVVDSHIWQDYNPSVPWQTGIRLQQNEKLKEMNTLHVGTYLPGSFETVAGAGEYAKKAVQLWTGKRKSAFNRHISDLKRALHFFTMPRSKAIDDSVLDLNYSGRSLSF